jgi:hypothetical protein
MIGEKWVIFGGKRREERESEEERVSRRRVEGD